MRKGKAQKQIPKKESLIMNPNEPNESNEPNENSEHCIALSIGPLLKNLEFLKIGKNHSLSHQSTIEITGEAGSGKTQLCCEFLLQTAMPKNAGGLEKGAIYITTVKPIPQERIVTFFNEKTKNMSIEEIAKVSEKVNFQKFNNSQFTQFIQPQRLKQFIQEKNIKTIIIDSFTGLCDSAFLGENNKIDYKKRNHFIYHSLITLKKFVNSYKLFLILVNNVTSDFSRKNEFNGFNKIKPCLGYPFENHLNTSLFVSKPKGNAPPGLRILSCTLDRSAGFFSIPFEIGAKELIFDIEDEER